MSAALSLVETSVFPADFATADQYGGPLRAAIAMQLVDSSATPRLPDGAFIDAMARRTSLAGASDDLDTVLGVANSYCERGYDVQFMGEPRRLQATENWMARLEDFSGARVRVRMPTAHAIATLLREHWSMLLHARSEAFEDVGQPIHPVLVRSINKSVIAVHNPGTETMPPQPNQPISLKLALGGQLAGRVSLLAVRKRSQTTESTRIGQRLTNI